MAMRATVVILATVATACRVGEPMPLPLAHADLGAPPADNLDAPPPRKGYAWVPGRWARSGDQWVWLHGYFERERPGYAWKPGRWIAVHGPSRPGPEVEWASSVREFSSEYSNDGWSAQQVLGAPDVYPAQGDMPHAWASATPDAAVEFIEVGYARPMRAIGVDIYETFNPGAVSEVALISSGGAVTLAADPVTDEPLQVRTECTAEPIEAVRVTLASAQVPGWNEIDAIGLVPCD
jgi:hypothetical protein